MRSGRSMRAAWLWLVLFAAGLTGCASSDGGVDATADAGPDATVVQDTGDAGQETPRPTGPWEVPIGPVDQTFHAGPWLGATTTTSVAVSWQTYATGDSVVEFGMDANYGGLVEGEADATLHEVWVTGLDPETLYHYRACTDDTCTGDLTFATAPLPGRPFRFAVYGDTQTDFAVHAEVAASMVESHPALVLLAGDVVGSGDDRESYVTEFFEPARRRDQYVPTFAVPGNHDWKDLSHQLKNFRDYFALPYDPDVPLTEASYSFTYGDAFFIGLDNTLDGGDIFFPLGEGEGPPLWEWLKAQAGSEAAQAAHWRFAFFHYPPQSACQETWFNMQATKDAVLPLLREHRFQAVFAGHTHEYEHQSFDGIHLFITGGGGGGLDTDDDCTNLLDELVFRKAIHHHLTVDLDAEQATVRAVSTTGEVVDEVVLHGE